MTDDGGIPTVQDMTFDHFSGRVGKSFDVAVAGHNLALILDVAQALPGSPRPGGAFRLEFVGPVDPMLVQGIFPFEIDDERFDIFVVPIGRDQDGMRYEAVFF
jgi:hypothetical protein